MSIAKLAERFTADRINIPDLEAVSPEYAKLVSRREELLQKAKALGEERREAIRAAADQAERKRSKITSIIRGVSEKHHREPAVIADEIRDVEEAIESLRVDIRDAAMSASATIREMIAPAHADAVVNIADAMLELAAAFSAYKAMADELNAKGIAWTALIPMHPNFLGDPDQGNGPLSMWLHEAAARGFIAKSRLPKGMRNG